MAQGPRRGNDKKLNLQSSSSDLTASSSNLVSSSSSAAVASVSISSSFRDSSKSESSLLAEVTL